MSIVRIAGVDMMAAATQHLAAHPSDPSSGHHHHRDVHKTETTTTTSSSNSSGSGEELVSLEAEITELQRENARVENQMLRLKSDINAMETHLNHNDRVSARGRWK